MPSKIKYLKVNGVTYELGESGGGGGSGTVTGIRMNGTIKGTSGIVDLGTVLTEHQSLAGYAKKTDIPTNLYDLSDDEEHRTVTDAEKESWNNKASQTDIPQELSNLSDDENHRLVSDVEKENWNNKADPEDIPNVFVNPIQKTGVKIATITVGDSTKELFAPKGEGGGGGASSADEVSYDDSTSQLGADNVQNAIENVVALTNMRYNEATDMIQIFDNGGWNNWQSAGRKQYVPLLPAMLSDTSPANYVVSASSRYGTSYPAWYAFDGINNMSARAWITVNNTKTNSWIQIRLPKPELVKKWTFWTRGNGIPKHYELRASNDGSEWVVLGYYTNDVTTAYSAIEHDLSDNYTAYTYYRMFIYDIISTSDTYIAVEEIQFYGIGEPFNGKLYDHGDERGQWTNGWNNLGYTRSGYTISNGTKNSDNMYFVGASTTWNMCGTQQKIDLTPYKKLSIKYKTVGTDTTYGLWLALGLSKLWDEMTSEILPASTGDYSIYEYDITNLNEFYYIAVGEWNNANRKAYVYEVTLS